MNGHLIVLQERRELRDQALTRCLAESAPPDRRVSRWLLVLGLLALGAWAGHEIRIESASNEARHPIEQAGTGSVGNYEEK